MGTITEKLAYLEQTKSDIKDALIAKGVEVGDSDSFRSYANKIENIPAGGASFEKVVLTNDTVSGSCDNTILTPYFGDIYDFSQLTSFNSMFKSNTSSSIDLTFLVDTSNVTDMSYMFRDCSGVTSLDLSNFDTSKVTNMSNMFRSCSKLTSLDLNNFDTSKVTNMNNMFSSCLNLTSLDLSNFDTSNVDIMYYNMFDSCSKLTKIYCKRAFYDWCIINASNIGLNDTMINGTVGDANEEGADYNWMIVDYM